MTALPLLLTTIILIGIGQTSLNVYYITYIIETLVLTELYTYFNNKARRGLNFISAVLFGSFLFIVSLEVFKMIEVLN